MKGPAVLFSREIRAIRERDPASRSNVEAILTSSGLHAIALHRVAHWLWRAGLYLPARLLSQLSRAITGIEIHPVTLGGTGKERGKRHPTVEDHAVIGVGAAVLGAVTIGAGARVGAGSVVLKDVPPHTTAVGTPARAVSWRDPASGETRRLEHLPDPDRDTMISLMQRIEELEARVREIEHDHADRETLCPPR